MTRRTTLTLAALLALAPCAPTLAQDAQPPAVAETEARFGTVDELLDALERSEEGLRALWCEVIYDRRFILQGDVQVRYGTLAFERTPTADAPAERAFAVDFTLFQIGDEWREERQEWAFRGRWLVERRHADKVFIKRELAPPGRSLDPLRLGQGPMPLPIGQRKDDILARYTPTLEPAEAGFDADDKSDDQYALHAQDCVQLKLVPKKDAQNPDEKFREVRLWYRVESDGGLLPVLSRTVDRSGDVVFVRLVGVQRADELPAEHAISLEAPAEGSGWDVQIERGRWDENMESVRIGAATPAWSTDVRAIAYAHPGGHGERRDSIGQEGATDEPPGGDSGERGGLGDLGPLGRDPSTPVRIAQPMQAPDVSETVLNAIGARYLTDEQRAERRVFHGLWTDADLEEPGAAAKAALQLGVWDHPSFDDDPFTDPLDRIEAMVRRGDLTLALDELGPDDEAPRAVRLRGEALEGLGRTEEAIETLQPLRDALLADRYDDADDIVQASRATWLHARLTGENAQAFQTMMERVTTAHQKLDRFFWPAVLVEAQLLESKGNAQESTQAAQQVLTMTPAAADAWRLLGVRSVAGFATDQALGVADRLDRLERRMGGEGAHSPMGDLVAARMYLRLNDPDLASLRVERVLSRYPRHREALALRCAVSATRYDYAGLEEHLSEFDAISPGHPLALFEAGSALSERRQYDRASEFLNRCVERAPGWAEPLVELGLMEVQAARDVIARDVLTRAVELDPFHLRAANSLALVEGLLTEFATVESEHFIVRYKPGVDEIMANEMMSDLEEMHDIVVGAMGHEPRRKTLVEVMPDHAWFSVRITGMPQIHTVAAATGPLIAMEAPKVGKLHTGVYNWLRVMRHEYTHTVTLDRTDNRIPLWHTEAAAVQMELAPRDYNTVRMLSDALANGTLFDLDKINLGFIRPEQPSDRSQAYAQANWMWQFIEDSWGEDANLEMMDRFAEGQRIPRVLDEMFDHTQVSFMRAFRAWAWDDVRTWGLAPEPSFDALRLEETEADPVLGERLRATLAEFARGVAESSVLETPVDAPIFEMVRPSPDLVDFWGEVYPDHPDVLRLRIEAMLESTLGNPGPEQTELLEAYAAARPTDPLPHRHLARIYLRSDEPDRSVPHLEFLDEREVYSPAYAVALARRYAERGDYERAMASALRATRIAPFDGDHRELAATVALRKGDFNEALRHIEALTVLEPEIQQHQRRLEALRARMDTADAG